MLSSLPILNGLAGTAQAAPTKRDFLKELGVRPIINGAGVYTMMTGSLMNPEAVRAIEAMSHHFVRLDELHDAVGQRIAKLLGCEAAMVPSGAAAGLTLAAAITYYDWNHKGNVLSPVVMGICRVLVYVAAGLCITLALPDALWIGAALMLCYLIGLTYVAKQENLGKVENLWPLAFLAAPVAYGAWLAAAQPVVGGFWLLFSGWMLVALWFLRRRRKGDIPRAVVSLIAGISLLDALLIAGTGSLALAFLALAGFALTLFFQRYIAGT